MLRRSSEGGIGTSDGLASQNIDPALMNSTVTSSSVAGGAVSGGAYTNHINTSTTGMSPGLVGNSNSRRAYSSMSGRYPRSWHPSPYASDDAESTDEPQFYKEEKKNRIKMEIARRRQQIEENACLHDELTRLAKLRETAEISDRLNVMPTNAYGASPMSPAMAAAAAAAAAAGVSGVGGALGTINTSTGAVTSGTSVLKSVDEILRSSADPMSNHHHLTGTITSVADLYPHSITTTSASTYGGLMSDPHHRGVTDFSPINSDLINHSAYRSTSADPTLAGLSSGYGSMTNSYGMSSLAGSGLGSDRFTTTMAGGKYSNYATGSTAGLGGLGTMASTSGVGGITSASSLYRKY